MFTPIWTLRVNTSVKSRRKTWTPNSTRRTKKKNKTLSQEKIKQPYLQFCDQTKRKTSVSFKSSSQPNVQKTLSRTLTHWLRKLIFQRNWLTMEPVLMTFSAKESKPRCKTDHWMRTSSSCCQRKCKISQIQTLLMKVWWDRNGILTSKRFGIKSSRIQVKKRTVMTWSMKTFCSLRSNRLWPQLQFVTRSFWSKCQLRS
jgi:hypothetical protein